MHFESIHDSVIRNAVAHSDYTLAHGEFRILKDYRRSTKKAYPSQVVSWEQLTELFTGAFAFYTALFSLYDRCIKSFDDFTNAFIPYDGHDKAVLQVLLHEDHRLDRLSCLLAKRKPERVEQDKERLRWRQPNLRSRREY